MMTDEKKQIDRMRADIARLTNSTPPESTNAKHLAERLAELRAIDRVSASMSRAARVAVERVLEAEMPGRRSGRTRMSELIRVALADYARKHGHDADAAIIVEDDGGSS